LSIKLLILRVGWSLTNSDWVSYWWLVLELLLVTLTFVLKLTLTLTLTLMSNDQVLEVSLILL